MRPRAFRKCNVRRQSRQTDRSKIYGTPLLTARFSRDEACLAGGCPGSSTEELPNEARLVVETPNMVYIYIYIYISAVFLGHRAARSIYSRQRLLRVVNETEFLASEATHRNVL